MSLIAKPIVKNQYWVVTDGDKKVGNVLATGSGFDVKINGNNAHFKTTTDINKKTQIEFQKLKKTKPKNVNLFSEYPTTDKVYNSVIDVKRKIHLYTKTQKSKCYYAAGWYVMNQTGEEEVIFCPKFIFVQRYPFKGPFKTKDEAEALINKK